MTTGLVAFRRFATQDMIDDLFECPFPIEAIIQMFWMGRLEQSGIYSDHDWPAERYVWSGRFQRRAKRTRLVDRMRAA